MSFNRLIPESDAEYDDDHNSLLSETGVIIKDVVPRSMHEDIECSCKCSCCPTISEWCIKDALGLTCAIVTWILFLYAEFAFIFVILTPKSFSLLFYFMNFLIFHALVFLAISSQLRTMFLNPGAVPLKNATPENLQKYEHGSTVYRCAMCQSIKPPRAHHCSVCQRCIKRMDHHCVFVNNCVGQNNQKYFILFTFYTCILSVYGLIMIGIHLRTCLSSDWTDCPVWPAPISLILAIGLGLEGLAFSTFTAVMCSSQLYSIYTDTNQIELYKQGRSSHREKKSFIESLKLVFGSHVGLAWLNPFSTPIYLITQNDEHIEFDV